jgi:5'(3')-deoxyribonucleotidase
MLGDGKRNNKGKTRHDLVPPFAQEQYARVLTVATESGDYDERNWESGMSWTKVIASAKRHLLAIEAGEDFDAKTKLYHAAHLMCNAAFLTEYYKIFPQGDDRPLRYLRPRKIGLDIDDVIADFCGAVIDRYPDMKQPVYWNDYDFIERFPDLIEDESFWMNIKPKCELPFEPHCYITSRSISPDITEAWLKKNRFPKANLYSVSFGASKVDAAKHAEIDIFVDDSYNNFVELNSSGVFCYLFDTPHNQRYNVGHRRIKSLTEIQ